MVRDWTSYTGEDNNDMIESMLYMNLDHIVLSIFTSLDSASVAAAARTTRIWNTFIGKI